jgi:hypothetical protein
MNNHVNIFLLGAFGGLLFMSSAFAHHGWGGYKEKVEMMVTITALKLGNPHDRLIATDEEGNEWNLLLAPPARNRRFGFNEDSVSVGDVIELYGQRHPDRLEMKVHCINKNGENLYTYRYDNGRTSLARERTGRDTCE